MSEQPGPNPYDPRPYPAYGQGGQYAGPPPDHPQTTMVLILGILGLVLCQVVSPFAWVIGGRVRKEIAASNGTIGGGQLVTVGWVLGIVGSCFLILGALLLVVYLAIVLIAIGTSA